IVEIAKEDADALVFRITAHNRGPKRAPLHLIPQLWFRNTWSWSGEPVPPPSIHAIEINGNPALLADDTSTPPLAGLLHNSHLGAHVLEFPSGTELLFTDNETNGPRVWNAASRSRYVKDAFHRRIVKGEHDAVNPANVGTKACGWQRVDIDAGASYSVTMRLAPNGHPRSGDDVIEIRRAEADEFYGTIHPKNASAE